MTALGIIDFLGEPKDIDFCDHIKTLKNKLKKINNIFYLYKEGDFYHWLFFKGLPEKVFCYDPLKI